MNVTPRVGGLNSDAVWVVNFKAVPSMLSASFSFSFSFTGSTAFSCAVGLSMQGSERAVVEETGTLPIFKNLQEAFVDCNLELHLSFFCS